MVHASCKSCQVHFDSTLEYKNSNCRNQFFLASKTLLGRSAELLFGQVTRLVANTDRHKLDHLMADETSFHMETSLSEVSIYLCHI